MHVDYYRIKGKMKLKLVDDSKKIELALDTEAPRELEGIIGCSDFTSGRSLLNSIMQYNEITLNYFSGNIGKLEWRYEDALDYLIKSGIFTINGDIVVTDSMSKENDFRITVKDNVFEKTKLNQ